MGKGQANMGNRHRVVWAAKMIPGVFLVVILGWHTDLNRGKVAKCACISSRSVILFNVS